MEAAHQLRGHGNLDIFCDPQRFDGVTAMFSWDTVGHFHRPYLWPSRWVVRPYFDVFLQ